MGLTCSPPKLVDESYEKFSREVTLIKVSYRKKAKMTTEVLNSMENVKCNEVAGAMYAFLRVTLPKKAMEAAKGKEMPPDEFYCWQALEKTGIYMIPGHFFDVKGSGNNFYYRITILPSEETFAAMFERLRTFHQEFMAQFKDTN